MRAAALLQKGCGYILVNHALDPDDLFLGLLGALHETGHAMYDLACRQDWPRPARRRDRGMALEEPVGCSSKAHHGLPPVRRFVGRYPCTSCWRSISGRRTGVGRGEYLQPSSRGVRRTL